MGAAEIDGRESATFDLDRSYPTIRQVHGVETASSVDSLIFDIKGRHECSWNLGNCCTSHAGSPSRQARTWWHPWNSTQYARWRRSGPRSAGEVRHPPLLPRLYNQGWSGLAWPGEERSFCARRCPPGLLAHLPYPLAGRGWKRGPCSRLLSSSAGRDTCQAGHENLGCAISGSAERGNGNGARGSYPRRQIRGFRPSRRGTPRVRCRQVGRTDERLRRTRVANERIFQPPVRTSRRRTQGRGSAGHGGSAATRFAASVRYTP